MFYYWDGNDCCCSSRNTLNILVNNKEGKGSCEVNPGATDTYLN